MNITITVKDEDLAMILQGLMCAAAISTDNGHTNQANEFHRVHNSLPNPYFPDKPELRYSKEGEGGVTKICGQEKDTFLCRACHVLHDSREDAEDCFHDERSRALVQIDYLKKAKPENWEYKCFALDHHYCK